MPGLHHAAHHAAVLEALIPSPPSDVAATRYAFSSITSRQRKAHVPAALAGSQQGVNDAQFAKARFIAEMYARASYSMLLISASGLGRLRLPVRVAALLPQSRRLAIRFGSALLMSLDRLLPRAVHRQLLLTSAVMGMLDVVLDETAASGQPAVLRISSLITRQAPTPQRPSEQPIITLAEATRRKETAWQSEYWETVLQPAVRAFCLAESLAITPAPNPGGYGPPLGWYRRRHQRHVVRDWPLHGTAG